MPFKSKAQRRKFYALKSRGEMDQKTIDEWEDKTPKNIPERVKSAMWSGLVDELQKIAAVYTRGLSMFHPTAVAASPVLKKLNPSELGQLQNIFRTAGRAAPKKAVPGPELMAALQKAKRVPGTQVHV
jgi:hypothetical protein